MSPLLPDELASALHTRSLEQALTAALAHFGCQAGTIHLLRHSVAGGEASQSLLHLAAHSGIPQHVVELIRQVPVGKGIAGLAAERREPITICNLQTDTSGQAQPVARTTGLEGSIAVPMLGQEGKLCGVLGIAKATAYDWSPDETQQLLAFAASLCSFSV